MMGRREFSLAILLVVSSGAPVLAVPVQKTPAQRQPARSSTLAPDIYPGDPIEKVKTMFGAEPGMRQERKELRYYQWWRPKMSVEIWTDASDRILSVKIRFKNVPIRTPDGIFLGKDSLESAEVKLGGRLVGESSSTYIVDADCWAFYIGATSRESSEWDVNYETIVCRKGDVSEEELRSAPINNMSRQVNGFTEPK